jgi:predicted glycosyltransferase
MRLRVLIAVTHLLGAGHLTRAAALARAFALSGHEVTLVSGGRRTALRDCERVKFVQLPSVHIVGTDFKTLLNEAGEPVREAHLAERRALLLDQLRTTRPDVLITELFPFGRRVLADEFMALLHEARRMRPRPLILSSVRDILVAPTRQDRIREAHDRLARCYDAVLVHGDPQLIPLGASWPLDEETKSLLHYTGYVDEDPAPLSLHTRTGIVVSGGSSAASLPLYRAALEAARGISDRSWRILVGQGIGEADFRSLQTDAPAHATVERARPDFRALLARAELSVSQAGYNTVVDVLRAGVRPVLVPFEAGNETEQRLRAETLKALDLAEIVPEAELSPEHLIAAIARALSRPAMGTPPVSLDGARGSVVITERLLRKKPALHRSIDWSRLDEALARAQDRDCPIGFWWRDDDAVAHTPKLDRLLNLADRYEAGIGLAVISEAVQQSLADRLQGHETAYALVHGWSHANHAPLDEKKAEFGRHRPVAAMAIEAADSLQKAGDCLGERLLPVFVPPWNRIAPELLPLLPSLGYQAVSAFRDRDRHRNVNDLVQINTHLDPIDWHGTRSVADSDALVAQLAGAVERRIDGAADPDEPIGLLTHHLVHDEPIWFFCEQVLDHLLRRKVRFLQIHRLFRNKSRIMVEL